MSTTQKRSDEMVELLRPDFFARNESNASWVHYQSAIMSTCALKGFWPMSAIHNVAPNFYARDVACDHDLLLVGGGGTFPQFGYLSSATITALPPFASFASANSQYMTFNADDSQHDITGGETYVSANERGLTLGGWFKFTTVPASAMGLMSKWYRTALPINQASYRLCKTATNNIVFGVSPDGTLANEITVTTATTVAAGQWYHIYGRYIASTEMAVFVDNVKTTNVVNIPAAPFNSTEPFVIGMFTRGNYLNGKASMCHLNAAQLSDSIIAILWEQSRVMYGKEG